VVVFDRVGQHPVGLLGQFGQRRDPQYVDHVLPGNLHPSPAFRLRTGAVFQGLDRAEQAAQAGFVTLIISRIGQPLLDRQGEGLRCLRAGLEYGQLRPDQEFELVQGRVVPGRERLVRDIMRPEVVRPAVRPLVSFSS